MWTVCEFRHVEVRNRHNTTGTISLTCSLSGNHWVCLATKIFLINVFSAKNDKSITVNINVGKNFKSVIDKFCISL